MQLGLPLGAPAAPTPVFATQSDFEIALKSWQSGLPNKSGPLRAAMMETPLGIMICVASADHLYLLEFADRPELARETAQLAKLHGRIGPGRTRILHNTQKTLEGYFSGQVQSFDLPLALTGSAFAQDVWGRLTHIPYGETRTYGALAQDMNRPTATRAVARANGANRIAIIVPCHRVIGADGTLTGYAGGLWRKEALLALEARGDNQYP